MGASLNLIVYFLQANFKLNNPWWPHSLRQCTKVWAASAPVSNQTSLKLFWIFISSKIKYKFWVSSFTLLYELIWYSSNLNYHNSSKMYRKVPFQKKKCQKITAKSENNAKKTTKNSNIAEDKSYYIGLEDWKTFTILG